MTDTIKMIEGLFDLALKVAPDVAPKMLLQVKGIVKNALFAQNKFTLINTLLLVWTSLTFTQSLWTGLFAITAEESLLKWKNRVKGLLLISLTVFFIFLGLSIPSLIYMAVKFIQNNSMISALIKFFPLIKQIIKPVLELELGTSFLVKTNSLAFLIYYIYFIFLFRWIFPKKISYLHSLIGATTFVLGLIISRSGFWIYMNYVRDNLIRSYGDYYTFILGIIWVYFVMGLFFYTLCLCHTYGLSKGKDLV